MKQTLAKQLYTQMASGLYPENIQGTCRIELADAAGNYPAHISYYGGELHFDDSAGAAPDTVVRMSPDTLSGILANADRFDLRDPLVLSVIETEGDLSLASFLFTLVKRPSKEVQALIQATEQQTAGYRQEITDIKRVHRPAEAEVLRLMAASVPFVITGVLDDWPLLSKNFSQLKAEYGDISLRQNLEEGREETLGDFISKMEHANGMVYTFGCPLPLAIWAETPAPFFEWDDLTSPQIWMGRKTGDRPCTTLHRDCNHNMLAQLFGRKKLILFSPDQSAFLYPIPAFNTFQPCSVGDVLHPDLEKFPAFSQARSLEVTLEPGELLVIPAFWYHCVYAVDDVLSISFSLLWEAWKNLYHPKQQ